MRITKDRPYYFLGLLVLIYMSNYVDRVVVGVLGEAIKTDLKLTDTHLGVLTGVAFAVFYGVLGIPIGRLADRVNRKWLITACITLWSGMTALSGAAMNFWHLFGARMLVGVGEAGCTPTAHSLLSDLFPKNKRSMAFGVYAMGPPLGIIVGALGGGWVAQHADWRWAMVAVGLPGLLLALLVAFTTREPVRGQQDSAEPVAETPPPFFTALRRFWADPVFVCVLFGMSSAAVALYSLSTFTVPYLVRAYDLSLLTAAGLFGLSYGIAGVIGSAVGGSITDWAGQKDGRWYAGVPAIGYGVGGMLLVAGLFQSDHRMFVALFVVGAVMVNIALAPSMALVVNRVATRMRASASAVVLLATTLIGLGLGPTLTGMLSDTLAAGSFAGGDFAAACPGGHAPEGAAAAAQQACVAASAYGLQHALAVTIAFYVLAGLIYLIGTRHTAKPPPAGMAA